MDERELRTMIGEVKRGRDEPPSLRPDHDRAGPDGPDGRADAGVGRGGPGPVEAGLQADQAGRRRRAQDAVVAGRHAAESRTSPPAPRTRTAHGSSTSRWPRGTRTATSRRPWPPRSRPCRTAGSRRTAARSPGSSRRAWPGTTASPSPPTTACSRGSTSPTPPPPPQPSAPTRTSRSRRSTATRSRCTSRSPRRSGRTPSCGVARHGPPQAPVRGLQGRQVARGAGQPQAGRHRPLPVRGLQAGRHRPRRAEPELPHAQPPLLRHHRDEGRR